MEAITMVRDKLLSVRFSEDELERIKKARITYISVHKEDISLNTLAAEAILEKVEKIEKQGKKAE